MSTILVGHKHSREGTPSPEVSPVLTLNRPPNPPGTPRWVLTTCCQRLLLADVATRHADCRTVADDEDCHVLGLLVAAAGH